VPKTVYRSSCRDKHNCQRRDSNLDPLTPQSDALTTRLLRPALGNFYIGFRALWFSKGSKFVLSISMYSAALCTIRQSSHLTPVHELTTSLVMLKVLSMTVTTR